MPSNISLLILLLLTVSYTSQLMFLLLFWVCLLNFICSLTSFRMSCMSLLYVTWKVYHVLPLLFIIGGIVCSFAVVVVIN